MSIQATLNTEKAVKSSTYLLVGGVTSITGISGTAADDLKRIFLIRRYSDGEEVLERVCTPKDLVDYSYNPLTKFKGEDLKDTALVGDVIVLNSIPEVWTNSFVSSPTDTYTITAVSDDTVTISPSMPSVPPDITINYRLERSGSIIFSGKYGVPERDDSSVDLFRDEIVYMYLSTSNGAIDAETSLITYSNSLYTSINAYASDSGLNTVTTTTLPTTS